MIENNGTERQFNWSKLRKLLIKGEKDVEEKMMTDGEGRDNGREVLYTISE